MTAAGDVISTDAVLDGLEAVHGIDITGASNTVVTSNTIEYLPASANAISVSGGSTGTTIENNIVTYPQATTATAAPAVAVDASSAAGTTLDYNVVYGGTAQTDYSWAGTGYQTAAALFAASGQGAHDVNADPLLYYSGTTFLTNSAPEINSANASAPGMLSTDFFGLACSGDPLVAITGAGTPADCARGAIQQTYSPSVTAAATAQGGRGVSLATTMAETAATGGGPPRNVYLGTTAAVSYTINWGDGHTQTAQASSTAAQTSTPHTYAKPGTYTITDTASLTTGGTVSTTTSFTTAGSSFTAMKPTRIFDTRNGTGTLQQPLDNGNCTSAQVTGVDGIPAGITAVAVNLTVTNTVGNGLFVLGSGNASNLNYSAGQTVANSAIVPLPADGRFDVCVNGNVGTHADAIIDVAGYFSQSTGAGFQPTAPDRALDTRVGTGAAKAEIGAKSSVSVPIVGVDSIPADVTAVAVHVTETNATGGGFIAAEPDGAGVPTTSSLNYGPGQTISNTVIVPIAADGKIELYNGALTGSVDLIADVSGYFSPTAPDAFMPVTPYRAVDTRLTTGSSLASDSTESFALGATTSGTLQSIPAGATMAANVTATDETAGGSLIVDAGGTPRPDTSALNFGKGQNIAGFGLFATTGSGDSISVYDDSPGSTDLVADVFGYFAAS
ncbi:MAG TPA: hypothetical protein VFN97_16945 [Actinospica sp.]|nr:hypothetical protein [Actinospica sp.]